MKKSDARIKVSSNHIPTRNWYILPVCLLLLLYLDTWNNKERKVPPFFKKLFLYYKRANMVVWSHNVFSCLLNFSDKNGKDKWSKTWTDRSSLSPIANWTINHGLSFFQNMTSYSNDAPCCLLPSCKQLETFNERFSRRCQKNFSEKM